MATKEKKERKRKRQKCNVETTRSVPPRAAAAHQALDRLVFEVVARLEDRRVHLLHRIAELDAEARQNVALPRVVLGVDARLDLLVIHDAHAKLLLRLRRVERRARALDLRQELLPERE